MLDKITASTYYKSLHFNHYKSGGTCEQRVLVLRARFDRILEEIAVKNFDSQNAYAEKLQQVFSAFPTKFKEKQKKECHALRKYLNGVQHSTYEADEDQYRISVQRLCNLIYLCSDVLIPQELINIWEKKHLSEKDSDSVVPPTEKEVKNTLAKPISMDIGLVVEIPMVICVDCLYIEDNELRRNAFNHALSDFITEICDNEIAINLRLILIGKKSVKYIISKTGETSTFRYPILSKDIITQAFNNSADFIEKHISSVYFHTSSLFVPMLSSELLNMLDTGMRTLDLERKKYLRIFPVGLTKGMRLDNFSLLSAENKAMVLRDDKYEEFFEWLFMSVKTICN